MKEQSLILAFTKLVFSLGKSKSLMSPVNNLSIQFYQVELQGLDLYKVNFFHFLINCGKSN